MAGAGGHDVSGRDDSPLGVLTAQPQLLERRVQGVEEEQAAGQRAHRRGLPVVGMHQVCCPILVQIACGKLGGSGTDDKEAAPGLHGTGVASATYPANKMPGNTARVRSRVSGKKSKVS